MLLRRPHVAGSFYPSDPAEIRAFCAGHFDSQGELPARAVILPHAGYPYSGATACKVLSRVAVPSTVILLGPDHWSAGPDFSVYPEGRWETPLGEIPVEDRLAKSVLETGEGFTADGSAHLAEHSLEVLLPLLQYKNPGFRIVPVLVGTLQPKSLEMAALILGRVLQQWEEPFLLAVSNDMSHYDSDKATRAKDQYALDAIQNLDAAALLERVKRFRITMCGIGPVYMLLSMKDQLGIQKATLVDYRTSGDATGDRERVVGYAGFIFE